MFYITWFAVHCVTCTGEGNETHWRFVSQEVFAALHRVLSTLFKDYVYKHQKTPYIKLFHTKDFICSIPHKYFWDFMLHGSYI